MRTLFFFLSLLTFSAFAQEEKAAKAFNKGKLYVYWGWNREWFTHSNITFIGENYQFTLYDVVAHDRQSPFNLLTYFNPLKLSIPQYNFRTGYFFAEHWDISFGQDHMKYVMQQNQQVKITGNIANSNTEYDGQYNNENILLSREFLAFEHTDGLNYVNLELRRNDVLFRYKKVRLNLIEGIGFGALVPRTNTLLMNKPRHDEFHLSGYGTAAVLALNVTFFDRFFIQSEVKSGFINMPNIETSYSKLESAKQHFFFTQVNVVFGAYLRFNKKK